MDSSEHEVTQKVLVKISGLQKKMKSHECGKGTLCESAKERYRIGIRNDGME